MYKVLFFGKDKKLIYRREFGSIARGAEAYNELQDKEDFEWWYGAFVFIDVFYRLEVIDKIKRIA